MKISELPEMEGDFKLVPSLAIMGTNPVWVADERYHPIIIDGKDIGSLEISKALLDRFGFLHLIDILGIRRGKVEWNLFQGIMGLEGAVWADVGVVYSEGIIDVLMSGADDAIVSTKMIASIDEIASSFELTENLILQIDYDSGIVAKDRILRNMEPLELVEEMVSLGVNRFIVDDITPGRTRVSMDVLDKVLDQVPENGGVWVGIDDKSEIRDIIERGADGAIISCSRLLEGLE